MNRQGLIWEDETGSHPITIEIPEELKAKAEELHNKQDRLYSTEKQEINADTGADKKEFKKLQRDLYDIKQEQKKE